MHPILHPTLPVIAVDDLRRYATTPVVEWAVAGAMLTIALGLVLRTRHPASARLARRSGTADPSLRPGTTGQGQRWLIGVAVAAAICVAGLGGVRSFAAVSEKFGSALVPLTADGMIIACTALRLAALTRGWRLPGSVATTYGFIAGTVWLNVAAANGWTDAVAHALAPVSYAVLVEMLAHLLRLHLRLAQPSRPRVTALTWATSPVVTTRVWLHLARTGGHDPVAARALVQQVIRMSSRLHTVCPSRPWTRWTPLDHARAARAAALQTIRDGLLSAAELAALLPADGGRLDAGALLALVDRAALRCTTPDTTSRTTSRTATCTDACTAAPRFGRTSAPEPVHSTAPRPVHHNPAPASSPLTAPPGRAARNRGADADLVAELHRHAEATGNGGPLSQREVMRVLGVGTPKAKRLAVLAGWAEPTPPTANGAHDETHGQLALAPPPDANDRTDDPAESAGFPHRREARNT